MTTRNIFLVILISLLPTWVVAQIPTKVFEIESILVDGCAGSDEGRNEMVIFMTGPSAVNINSIRVDGAGSTGSIVTSVWPNTGNPFLGWETPGTMATEVAQINATISNCGRLIEPMTNSIPAGKKCLIITSTEFDPTAHSFASLADTLYVIFQVAGNTAGHFVNYGTTSERTLVLTHTGGSGADTVRYDRVNLLNQSGVPGAQDGAGVRYSWSGIPTYYNDGCQAPFEAISAAWTSPGNVCVNDSPIDLSSFVTGSLGGTWSGSGVSGFTFDPSSLSGNITITYVVGTNPCADTISNTITVILPTGATITPIITQCTAGSPVTLQSISPGGVWSGQGITNTSLGVFSPSVAGAGSHDIIYTIGGSCGGADTITIDVIQSANATITAAGPFCIASPATNLIAANPGGVWNGPGITNTALGTFNPAVAGAGIHTITYGIIGLCGDTGTIQIEVVTQISADITPAGPFCDNIAPLNLAAANAGGSWTGTGITNASAGTFDASIAGQGNHDIIYTITGACGDADTATITVYESPLVNFLSTNESCIDQNDGMAWVQISGGTLPYSILWSNGETTDSVFALAPGSISVLVTDLNGCNRNESIVIAASGDLCYTPHVYVPNIFSPNDDGVNDVLWVHGLGVIEMDFIIYDRWGEKMFRSQSLDQGWNGTIRNVEAVPDVYVYYLSVTFADGTSTVFEGNFTLVR